MGLRFLFLSRKNNPNLQLLGIQGSYRFIVIVLVNKSSGSFGRQLGTQIPSCPPREKLKATSQRTHIQIQVRTSKSKTKEWEIMMMKAPRMWKQYGGLNYQTLLYNHQILRFLPTKSAVRMSFLSKQWEGVWSSVPILDFDEGNIDHTLDNQPRKFIKIWERYADQFRENDKQVLDKFMLRMRYFVDDATLVDKWLNFAIVRGVKELDISLPKKNAEDRTNGYLLSLRSVSAAKYLTSLNLEHVGIQGFSGLVPCSSLKGLSLKNVDLENFDLIDMFKLCLSIEHLSLTSCVMRSMVFLFPESSLKYLEIMHCSGARLIVVRAMYLKSLKFVSGSDQSWRMRLEELAIMGAKNLRSFVLCGSICYVKDAFINPKVTYFLFNGSVKLISSIKLGPAGSSEHLSALRDYLESFDCSEDMSLYIQDAKCSPSSFQKVSERPALHHCVIPNITSPPRCLRQLRQKIPS